MYIYIVYICIINVCLCRLMTILEKVIKLARSLRVFVYYIIALILSIFIF